MFDRPSARDLIQAIVLLCGLAAAQAEALPLMPVADVPLGGHATRLDYASQDPGRHLLFVAHLGDSAVIVIDTKTQRVVTRIPNISKVHGVLAIPELGRLYASATGSNEVVAIDENTLQIVARTPAGVYPDGMAYAPDVHKLYVSDEHGNTDTVIDVNTNTRVATIALGGEVGNTQYDPVSKHIFSNVQTLGRLAEIDPTTDEVVARIHLPGAQGNHGLLIEPEQRQAFVACEGNEKLLVLDMSSKTISATFENLSEPDVLAYDPGLQLLYVAGESGVISMFKVERGKVSKVAAGFLGPNAHVVSVDPVTHLAYFPIMNLGGHPMLRIMRPIP